MRIQIISFYKFFNVPKDEVKNVEARLYTLAQHFDTLADKELTLRGLLILGTEGANATFSIPENYAEDFKSELLKTLQTSDVTFKNSYAEKHVFHDFNVKVRNEIVSLDRPDLIPQGAQNHITPDEWHKVILEENPIIIDTRNSYEFDVGHFKGAIDPKIEEFNEYPAWLKKSEIPKDKKILIYCTGGIRCEKAILEMNEQGYNNVYQLDGGILNYLEKYPEGHWDGECFVFDYRIAVDSQLQASKTYKLCPHCGQPAKTKISCVQCGVEDTVCNVCLDEGASRSGDILKSEFRTCSKNCAHHFRMGHKSTRVHTDAFNRRVIT